MAPTLAPPSSLEPVASPMLQAGANASWPPSPRLSPDANHSANQSAAARFAAAPAATHCSAADGVQWDRIHLTNWSNDIMTPCGRQCGAGVFISDCVGQCASTKVPGGFGAACIACIDELAKCSARECMIPCIHTLYALPDVNCKECSEAACYSAFYACSGLHSKHR